MKDARCSKCRIRSQRRRSESNPLVTVTTKVFSEIARGPLSLALSGWHLTAGAWIYIREYASWHERSASPPTPSRSPDKRNPLTLEFSFTPELKWKVFLCSYFIYTWRPERAASGGEKIALEGDAHGQISVSLSGSHGVQRGLCLYARHLNKTHTCAAVWSINSRRACTKSTTGALFESRQTPESECATPLLQPEEKESIFIVCIFGLRAHSE